MTTIFVKILTAPKSFSNKMQQEMFRTMVAVKGEKKGLSLVGPRPKMDSLAADRFVTITRAIHGDTGVTITSESSVSIHLHGQSAYITIARDVLVFRLLLCREATGDLRS